ncbi:hypothetical protein FKP32DRAFT_876351 [Trametes sanguinea]|nr:hypothetical protein FKP32DRAFT_876351 [Trametes sanguinea]
MPRNVTGFGACFVRCRTISQLHGCFRGATCEQGTRSRVGLLRSRHRAPQCLFSSARVIRLAAAISGSFRTILTGLCAACVGNGSHTLDSSSSCGGGHAVLHCASRSSLENAGDPKLALSFPRTYEYFWNLDCEADERSSGGQL